LPRKPTNGEFFAKQKPQGEACNIWIAFKSNTNPIFVGCVFSVAKATALR